MTLLGAAPLVAVLYTIMPATKLVMGDAEFVAVNATLGISTPLEEEVMSRTALASGLEVPMPTFC